MRTRIAFALALAAAARAGAQAPVNVVVRVTADGAPIERAIVRAGTIGAVTTPAGTARLQLPAGPHLLIVSRLGYLPDSTRLQLAGRDTTLDVELEPAPTALEGVIVVSARGARRIEEEPTRVEVLSGDDVAEKTEMRPSDVTHFLSEMPGVRLQQTSAASGAAGIRIQGLRPRYTLLLADGLPSYGGTGGSGLDLLQVPPADLRQIEVVKGPASALYGASALGGTINLVSKRPAHEGDLLVQGTSQQGTNAFGWISRRVNPNVGYTTVAGFHRQSRRDTDADGWYEMPGFTRAEVRPRLFLDGAHGASLFLTGGATVEDREGGSHTVFGTRPIYRETLRTRRGDLGLVAHRLVGNGWLAQWRAAANVDDKQRRFGTEPEDVRRSTAFTEVSLAGTSGKHDWLGGLALQRDAASIHQASTLDYGFTTGSAFAQETYRATRQVSFIASARADRHSRYGTQVSPRASLLYAPSDAWGLRVSGSRGFYAPTPFVEETEAIGVRRVAGFNDLRAENASYGSIDLTGKQGPFELNATVFASRVAHQVVASTYGVTQPGLFLSNSEVASTSRGLELFAVYDLEPLFITALYAHTRAREFDPCTTTEGTCSLVDAPFVPRNSGGIDVTWEAEETGTWIAVEAFYTGTQRLSADPTLTNGKPYTTVGILASQRIGPWKLFLNVENLGNLQQSRWAPVRRAIDPLGRQTVTPWAPLEGRVLSAGIRRSFGGDHAK